MLRRMGRQDTEYRVGPQSDDVPEVGGGRACFCGGGEAEAALCPPPLTCRGGTCERECGGRRPTVRLDVARHLLVEVTTPPAS